MQVLETVSDCKWLEGLSTGREDAYKLLFSRYYAVLGVFAYRYLNDRSLCEDAVHDVLLELFQTKERFNTIVALKTYLYNAVRNRCVDILRHDKVKARYAEQIVSEKENAFCYSQILEAESYLLLKKAIAELPEQTRIVYDLVIQGYNNSEISRKMGLTEDAVKAHKKRGKKLLRDKLKYLLSSSLIIKILLS